MPQDESATADVVGQVADLYDRFTAISAWDNNLHFGYWDDPDSDIPIEQAANRLTDLMAAKLRLGPSAHLLDVGCGVGGPGVRIARLSGAKVTGISVSQGQVGLANSLAESTGLAERVSFQHQDALEMSFPDNSFDGAIAIESMMNMPDRERVLTRIGRSLRPGGRVVLTDAFARGPVPADKQPAVDRFFDGFTCSMVMAEDYPPLLRRAGLWFEELVDITEHTMRKSWTILSERFTRLAPQLSAVYGDEMAARFDTTDLLDVTALGYLMVVARRPQTGISV